MPRKHYKPHNPLCVGAHIGEEEISYVISYWSSLKTATQASKLLRIQSNEKQRVRPLSRKTINKYFLAIGNYYHDYLSEQGELDLYLAGEVYDRARNSSSFYKTLRQDNSKKGAQDTNREIYFIHLVEGYFSKLQGTNMSTFRAHYSRVHGYFHHAIKVYGEDIFASHASNNDITEVSVNDRAVKSFKKDIVELLAVTPLNLKLNSKSNQGSLLKKPNVEVSDSVRADLDDIFAL